MANGQVSPFDLKHRLSKEEQTKVDRITPAEKIAQMPTETSSGLAVDTLLDEIATPESSPVIDSQGAQTDSSSVDVVASVDLNTPSDADKPVNETSAKPFAGSKNQSLFLFLMLIAATILTTLTISSNRSLVNNILRAVLNDNYLNLMYREQKKSGAFHYYILYFVFAVNAGLFLYFLLSRMVFNSGMPMLWRCVVLVGIIYSARHLFMSYLSHVYPFQKELEQYAFTILIFNIFLGLLLLPINVFVAFCPEPIATFFLYGGLAIVVIVYIFRQLRGVFISSRLLFNNKFYFLLYICAVEIAPVLLLVKYFGAYVS